MAPALPSMTEPAGVSVLPLPAAAVSKVWVNAPVSVPASVPEVTVGMPAESVVPSNAFVSVTAVTVMARAVISPVVSVAKVMA